MFRKKNNKTNKPAFTLVELLVVIAIIGVLATLAMVSIQSARIKARDTKRIADIKQIQTALELFFNDNGLYPASTSVTSSINSGTKVYMEVYPQAPTPPDGDCTEESNQYVYTEAGEDNGSYSVSFCIGSQSANLNSGDKCATPMGILNSSCSGEEEGVPEEEEEEEVFVCGESTVTYQGHDYTTVQIVDQCWFKENLQYDNGCSSAVWVNSTDVGWCGCYDNSSSNCTTYGRLYQWSAAMNGDTAEGSQGLCPEGWHIPTHPEFTTLERAVCTTNCTTNFPNDYSTTGWRGTDEGYKLRAVSPLYNGSDAFGFRVLPSGGRYTDGIFLNINTAAFFKSSSSSGSSNWDRIYSSANNLSGRNLHSKAYAWPIRCLKNQ